MYNTNPHAAVSSATKKKTSPLRYTALMLGVATCLEFLLALTMPRGGLLVSLFITLTFVKAFYIMAEFMHLKYEVKALIAAILVPIIMLLFLIAVLFIESC